MYTRTTRRTANGTPQRRALRLGATLALLASACESISDPVPITGGLVSVSTSSITWNQIARDLIAARSVGTPTAQARLLVYLSIAQYNAVVDVDSAVAAAAPSLFETDAVPPPSPAAAAAGASHVILMAFFPQDAALLDSLMAAQRAVGSWPGESHTDFGRGESIGRDVASRVLAFAATDNTNLTTRPVNPGGPGTWTGVNSLRGFLGARAFALTSSDQFRPLPPPTFGSDSYLIALQEVRTLSDELTGEQLPVARDWAPRGPAYMNAVAVDKIGKIGLRERHAARILTLANMAGFDVANACFDAKLAYYFIRPSQADSAIKLPIGLPNHPSYPSGHSCFMAAYATVLAAVFPDEEGRLRTLVADAGLSRMYAGLHYRFDVTAGQELGQRVAHQVMATVGSRDRGIPLY